MSFGGAIVWLSIFRMDPKVKPRHPWKSYFVGKVFHSRTLEEVEVCPLGVRIPSHSRKVIPLSVPLNKFLQTVVELAQSGRDGWWAQDYSWTR